VGVIVRQDYICDYCGKPMGGGDVIAGQLTLRKRGARGLAREYVLTLHPACSTKLTEHATRTVA
jgi:hypothetical protein